MLQVVLFYINTGVLSGILCQYSLWYSVAPAL